ncbi:Hypothetical predicted protein [Scomber scombrus]|uniref:Uncharacterized protein n=1 Tax=Scomber scombrus TaxID=13677 RepID=A0AAV1Q474_SCOSC
MTSRCRRNGERRLSEQRANRASFKNVALFSLFNVSKTKRLHFNRVDVNVIILASRFLKIANSDRCFEDR